MTEHEQKQHDAKAIVQEALATIMATYWIKDTEFSFVFGDYDFSQAGTRYFFDERWDTIEKAIVVAESDETPVNAVNPEVGKAKVTGVCSIGALALANVTLYDEPLLAWSRISERDLETWKAGAAVAMAVLTENPGRYDGVVPGDVIAPWNDHPDTTREDVIKAFETALESPLLASKAPVEIVRGTSWGHSRLRLWFADEAAAQEFLDGDSKLRKQLTEYYGSANYVVLPVEHEALEATDAAS